MTDSVIETVTIANDEAGARLDRVLAGHIATLSRSHLKTLILRGHVTLRGARSAIRRQPSNRAKSSR